MSKKSDALRKQAEKNLLVDYSENLKCPYKSGNGSGNMCNCPTRHEIYHQTER